LQMNNNHIEAIILDDLLVAGKSGWMQRSIKLKEFLRLAGISYAEGRHIPGCRFSTSSVCVDLDTEDCLIGIVFSDLDKMSLSTSKPKLIAGVFRTGECTISPVFPGDSCNGDPNFDCICLQFPCGFLLFENSQELHFQLKSVHITLKI
jgi:hypothetical protein